MLTPPPHSAARERCDRAPGNPPSTSISVCGSLPQPHSIPLPPQPVDFQCDFH